MIRLYYKKSLLEKNWKIKDCDERESLMISQRHDLPPILGKLLTLRNIKDENVENFLNPNFFDNIPDPFDLKDMLRSIERTIIAISNKEKIGIIADYDVDGSTSAAILFNFLSSFNCEISLKIPHRIKEGYGPNIRIMDEFVEEKVDLIFILDCGTSSFGIVDNLNYKDKDIIIIDHHISEFKLPKIFSIINPNRFDENNLMKDLAAVGVTFLFVMGLRRKMRESDFFNNDNKEPNLLYSLDLVALGTVCDVVNLNKYNRNFVKKGLEIIKKRSHKGIASIIDKSQINRTLTSDDLGFVIGPKLNAASRIDDSSLSSKILISNNLLEIESIANKLSLLNDKRKLIENNIFEKALEQAKKQINQKLILVQGFNWHNGVLGIIASRLVEKFNKPSIVISIDNHICIGSARSIDQIDLGNIIIKAKHEGFLINGGGHKMAAGFKIDNKYINKFHDYLIKSFEEYDELLFQKIDLYDAKLSINEINLDLLKYIEKLEPFGKGNKEPMFIVHGLNIDNYKIIKEKHLLIFFKSEFGIKIKAISFNSVGTKLGENLMHNKSAKFEFGCTIKRDNFSDDLKPQLIIKDAMIIN